MEIIENIVNGMYFNNFDIFNNVGVITPYKAQEALLVEKFNKIKFENIFTIDKSQGIEKEMIIISFVKTNNKSKILRDIARLCAQ